MKVLFFSHQADFIYGGEVCTLSFMEELGRNGVEVHFASPPGPYQERVRSLQPAPVVHTVPSIQFSRKPGRLPALVLALLRSRNALARILETGRIGIVHATSLKAMVYCAGISGRASVVWHHHDILPRSGMNQWWLKRLAGRARLILAPSEATRSALLEAGVEPQICVKLHNGFRPGDWKKRPARSSYSPFRVSLIGEISPRKGTDRLVEILQALKKEEGADGVEFQLIGEGLSDPSFAAEIRRSLQGESVVFLGRRENVKELLQKVDLLLVPSRQDPLPTVIVEAAFSGVPAVGSRAGGIPEMIREGENGFLAGSNEEFARAIHRARDIGEWERLSAGARKNAEENFDLGRQTDQLIGLYRRICDD